MAPPDKSEHSNFKRFLPTLLTEIELKDELSKRSVKMKTLDTKSKDELLQLYMCHFMSLPQREFPNNHHGKLINQMIQKEHLKSKKHELFNSNLQFGFSEEKGKLHSSLSRKRGESSSSSSCERLKPPVSKSDISSKKISLSRSSSSSDQSLEKIVIKNRHQDQSEDRKGASKANIELKRTLSDSEKSNDESSPPKKARQRIAWP